MKELIKRQIAQKVEEIQRLSLHLKGVPSWIQYIRQALGMSPKQLAERMAIAESSLYQLERQESLDKASIKSLKKAAEAMGCEFVYAIVPKTSIEDLVHEQARKKALKIISDSQLQMEYEDQAVSKEETDKQFEELCEKIKNSKQLWAEK
ncbi:MAG: mobile mystery protein A [Bdellovibrionales bacterium]